MHCSVSDTCVGAAAKGVTLTDHPKKHVGVLIVDDDPLFRLAVAAALPAEERLECDVAEACDGQTMPATPSP